MAREIVFTDKAPRAHASYSQAVKAGGLVFVSGQGPFDPATGEVVGETIQQQTAQCLRNVEAILQAANSSLKLAVSATVLLVDGDDFAGMNEEWAKWFAAQPPARHVSQLPVRIKGMRLSVAMVAAGTP